ncbi:hypothetical protein AB0O20_36785 [Streptomyces kronopolitis]|uniref:hypothetical protein n=1 Tax=Streptomyces kronopolitis TaxID=1612435 RepID=UPI003435A124
MPLRAAVRMWGRLQLSGVTAAARQEDYGTAGELLGVAERCTQIVTVDDTDTINGGYHAAFGPSRVRMVAAELAMSQENLDRALELSAWVSATRRIPPMTRRRHLLDVANAHAWKGELVESIGFLTKVKAIAPEWMRYQVLAREVVRTVQTGRGRRRLEGLQPLAVHVGLRPAR